MTENPRTDFERGEEAGREKQKLDEVIQHSKDVNGAIASMKEALSGLVGEIRGLREDARLREERVETARVTLANETERRRIEIADATDTGDRKFGRRDRLVGGAVGLGLLALTIQNTFHLIG